MKKEIPILFSTAMVQAILAGRKTMTRRVVKPQPVLHNEVIKLPIGLEEYGKGMDKWQKKGYKKIGTDGPAAGYLLPDSRWQPGDLLWVRETWREYYHVDENGYTQFDKKIIEFAADKPGMILQKDGDGFQVFNKDGSEKFIPFKPSIHMPKNAARIWLEVADVKVERLQDISEEDAIAEGVERWTEERMKSRPTHYKIYCDLDNPKDPATYSSTAKCSFETLWHLINGKESWDANPWVWVVSFKILSTTGKP